MTKSSLARKSMLILILLFFTQSLHAYYCPSTGRFLSRDPIGEQGGANVYAFARNSPIGQVDHLGLKTIHRCCVESLLISHLRCDSKRMKHSFMITARFLDKSKTQKTESGDTICCDPDRCQTKQELHGRMAIDGYRRDASGSGTPLETQWSDSGSENWTWHDDHYENKPYNKTTKEGSDLNPDPLIYLAMDEPGLASHISPSVHVAMAFHFRFTISDSGSGDILARRHYSVFIIGGPERRRFHWFNFNNGSGSETYNHNRLIDSGMEADTPPGLSSDGLFDPGPI